MVVTTRAKATTFHALCKCRKCGTMLRRSKCQTDLGTPSMIGPSGARGSSTRSKIGSSNRMRKTSSPPTSADNTTPGSHSSVYGSPKRNRRRTFFMLFGPPRAWYCAKGPRNPAQNECESPSPYCIRADPAKGSGHGLSGEIGRTRCYDGEMIRTTNLAWAADLRTVFLDRDGILNEKMPEHRYVTRWDEFRVLPGVPESLRRFNDAGLRVVV